MTMDDFLAAAVRPDAASTPPFHYYTRSALKEDGFGALLDDIKPHDFLIVRPQSMPNANHMVNVWFGGPGITAQQHYDQAQNFYCQVRGKKRFLIAPPSSWFRLYPYPTEHPCDRQSQVDFARPDAHRWPLAYANRTAAPGLVPVLVVDLDEGDMLYLPPFWYHWVQSQSLSLSVNVWTDSEEGLINSFTSEHPFPAVLNNPRTPSAQRRAALWLFIQMLIKAVFGKDDGAGSLDADELARRFVRLALYEARYRLLEDRLPCGDRAICERIWEESSARLSASDANDVAVSARAAGKAFLRMPTIPFRHSVMVLEMAAFVETLVSLVEGDLAVCGVLRCWSQDPTDAG
jgi:hypothetical protein